MEGRVNYKTRVEKNILKYVRETRYYRDKLYNIPQQERYL